MGYEHTKLAMEEKGNKIAYINNLAELVIPVEFDYQTTKMCINSNLILVSKNGKFGFYDHYGSIIIPLIYDRAYYTDELSPISAKSYILDKDGKKTYKSPYKKFSIRNIQVNIKSNEKGNLLKVALMKFLY